MAAPCNIQQNSKLSKAEKKLRKKQFRSQKILWKHDGIETSDVPTQILCVNKAGLDNGVSLAEVQNIFSSHGNVEEVIMLPRKPYAFVCYGSKEQAEKAYTVLNGSEVCIGDENKRLITLYIFYVSKAPPSLSPSPELPPGLIILKDFIDTVYEDKLLQSVSWEDSPQTAQQKTLKHRQVKHYGYEFKYGINNVDPDDPLLQGVPDVCKELLDRALQTGYVEHFPDQLTINQYQCGQGIPPHVDTPSAFEDGLMSLSLGSQAVMEFHHPNGRHLSVLLPPRSLLIMTGDSRYIWSHAITPRKSDIIPTSDGGLTLVRRGTRISFTFRKLTGQKCKDTAAADGKTDRLPATESDAASLEKTCVHEVYEKIADHFSGTRHSPWPRISAFLKVQPMGSLLMDIGCGNGKYFGLNSGLYEIGSDRSSTLVQICNNRGFQVLTGDVLAMPLRSGVFDLCLCIAVVHHLSTQARRSKAVSEILRILRPGGKAVIYVWAFEQELHKIKSKYLKESKLIDRTEDGSSINSLPSENTTESPSSTSKGDGCGFSDKSQTNTSEVGDQSPSGSIATPDGYSPQCILSTQTDINNQSVEDITFNYQGKLEINSDEVLPANQELTENQNLGLGNESNSESNMGHSNQLTDKLSIHVNRTQFKQQDMLVPWQLKESKKNGDLEKEDSENTCYRYYHVFKQGDLENLCQSFSHCRIIESYYDQGNWAVILEKISKK